MCVENEEILSKNIFYCEKKLTYFTSSYAGENHACDRTETEWERRAKNIVMKKCKKKKTFFSCCVRKKSKCMREKRVMLQMW
jgi:hypothetical protein